MALAAILPNCDLGSRQTGRRKWHPVVRVNEMGSGDSVVFLNGGGYRPDQALLKNILIGLHPSAELAVKRKLCISVCLKAGSEALYHNSLCKASHEVTACIFVFSDFKEDTGSFGNTKLKSADIDLLCEDNALFLGSLFALFCSLGSPDYYPLGISIILPNPDKNCQGLKNFFEFFLKIFSFLKSKKLRTDQMSSVRYGVFIFV
jgi:hypothetical protein